VQEKKLKKKIQTVNSRRVAGFYMMKNNSLDSSERLSDTFTLVLVGVITLPLTILSQYWLPSQFLRDNTYYGSRLNSNTTGYDDSFNLVTSFYRLTNLENQRFLIAAFQWLLCVLCIFLLKMKIPNIFESRKSLMIACIFMLLVPFYFGFYTKEVIIIVSFLVFLILFNVNNKEKTNILLFIICFLPLGLLRPYKLIILFICISILSWAWRAGRIQILFLPILLTSLILTVEAWTGLVLKTTGTNLLNLRYQLVTQSPYLANSTIEPSIFTVSFFRNSLDLFKVFFEIAFPFTTNVSIYTFFGILLAISAVFILSETSFAKPADTLLTRFFKGLILAYLAVALIFEPDVGSFLRHTSPYLLIVLLIRGLSTELRAISQMKVKVKKISLPTRLK
jgi:hypothetical protein